MRSAGQTLKSSFSTLSWAIFLGMSWTWCIGMFLPVLLVRDYGVWAFVVFAVPNVIGAAAMAWVLPDADASRRWVEKPSGAVRWFSTVTVFFHLFFVVWIGPSLLGRALQSIAVFRPEEPFPALITVVAVAFVFELISLLTLV